MKAVRALKYLHDAGVIDLSADDESRHGAPPPDNLPIGPGVGPDMGAHLSGRDTLSNGDREIQGPVDAATEEALRRVYQAFLDTNFDKEKIAREKKTSGDINRIFSNPTETEGILRGIVRKIMGDKEIAPLDRTHIDQELLSIVSSVQQLETIKKGNRQKRKALITAQVYQFAESCEILRAQGAETAPEAPEPAPANEPPLGRLLNFKAPKSTAPYANVVPPRPQISRQPSSSRSDNALDQDRGPRRTRIDIAPERGILRGNTNNSPKNTTLMSQESPFQAYAAKKDTAEKKRAEEADLRPTLADILAKESKQFGDMLESYDDPEKSELAQRMLSRNLNPEDTAHLAELRNEYLSRKEAGERLNEGMTDEYIDELARYSDEFDNLRGIIGVEALRNIIRSGITDKAIADPDNFRELAARHQKLIEIEKQADPANDAIKKICKKYDLASPRAIVDAMAIEDRGEREAALRSALRSEMGVFKKLFERGSKQAAREVAEHVDSFDELRRQRTWVMENTGRFIAELVSDDPEMRHSLTRALYKERVNIKREPPLALEKLSGSVPTEEAVQGEWEAYKEANNWAGLADDNARNAARTDFEAAYKKKNFPVRQGFWAKILGIFGGDLFGDKLQ